MGGVALRNRLLNYDLTMAERTRVYDDQADYFPGSSGGNMAWMDEAEREEEERREEERRERVVGRKGRVEVSIDLAGRRVLVQEEGGREVGREGVWEGLGKEENKAAEEVARLTREFSGRARIEEGGGRGGGREGGVGGASQLSGRAQQVFEGLHTHFSRVKAANEAKKKKKKGRKGGEEEDGEEGGDVLPSRIQTEFDRLVDEGEEEDGAF